jgi:hypothetical protein
MGRPKKIQVPVQVKEQNIFNLEGFKMSEVKQPYINEAGTTYEWIQWDRNNLFSDELIDAFNTSPIHNSITITKKEMSKGRSIMIEPDKRGIFSFLSSNKHRPTQDFIDRANSNGESLRDVLDKLFLDFYVFGMCYIQPGITKGGKLEIYHIPADRMRANKCEQQGLVKRYWYSADWHQYRRSEYIPTSFPRYDGTERGLKTQSILPIMPYRSGNFYYSLPEWYPAMNWIKVDGMISRFHLSNLTNGLSPSLLIQMNQGVPPEEQRREIKKRIEDTLTGTFNAGKFLLLFNDTKENEASIEPLQVNDLDKQFTILNEQVLQNIITSSRVTSPMLVGIKTQGQLGGANEIVNSFELFYNSAILPTQLLVMDKINQLGNLTGLKKMVIETSSPIDYVWSESVLAKILTINEMRKEIGREPLEGEDVLVDYKKETQNVPVKNNSTANGK